MMPLAAMEQERLSFLSELYTRSAGDARQGIPYEALIDALGFGAAVTKLIQRELQWAGLVALTAVPPMTTAGRPAVDRARRQPHQQTISMTPQGVRLMEAILATRHTAPPHPSASSDENTTVWRLHATEPP
jgi:hypothetical protein